MRRLIWGMGLLAGLWASTASAEEGWVSLFDGETLSGWTPVELKGKTSKWEVKDGALCGSGEQSMLYSPMGHYKNFKFRAEVKINDGGNSGMYVRTPKEASFSNGYEIQVNSTHKDPVKTGSIYTHVNVYKQIVPPDTWFTQEVEVVDRMYRGKMIAAIKITVNGETLYEFQDFERPWANGHFAFQQHDPGSQVMIRKVEVMELPESPAK